MLTNLEVIIAIIGSVAVIVLALVKSRPDINKIQSDAFHSQADAAETWAQSSKLAAEELLKVQDILASERTKRRENEKRITELETEIAAMRKSHDAEIETLTATIATQKIEIDKVVAIMKKQDNMILLLADQVVHLGGTPITGKAGGA